jgi:hypothetical protein
MTIQPEQQQKKTAIAGQLKRKTVYNGAGIMWPVFVKYVRISRPSLHRCI